MLAKKFRLTESEVKKVLKRQEPFFSYGIVLCRLKNMYNHNRYAIVISSKSVHSNVERNFFRRKFYEYFRVKIDKKSENDSNFEKDSKFKKLDSSISFQNLDSKTLENLDLQALENAILFKGYDFVFVVKQTLKLNKDNPESVRRFIGDLIFLDNKILKLKTFN